MDFLFQKCGSQSNLGWETRLYTMFPTNVVLQMLNFPVLLISCDWVIAWWFCEKEEEQVFFINVLNQHLFDGLNDKKNLFLIHSQPFPLISYSFPQFVIFLYFYKTSQCFSTVVDQGDSLLGRKTYILVSFYNLKSHTTLGFLTVWLFSLWLFAKCLLFCFVSLFVDWLKRSTISKL